MGLFDRSSTTQNTEQNTQTVESGLSETQGPAVGSITGGSVNQTVTDFGAVKSADQLAQAALETNQAINADSTKAVQSIASQALGFGQKTIADTYKASGDQFQAEILALGAANQEALNTANNALYYEAQSAHPGQVTQPSAFTAGNVQTLIKVAAIVAGVWILAQAFKGRA